MAILVSVSSWSRFRELPLGPSNLPTKLNWRWKRKNARLNFSISIQTPAAQAATGNERQYRKRDTGHEEAKKLNKRDGRLVERAPSSQKRLTKGEHGQKENEKKRGATEDPWRRCTHFWVVPSWHRRPDGDFDGLVFGDVAEALAAPRLGRRVPSVHHPIDLCNTRRHRAHKRNR